MNILIQDFLGIHNQNIPVDNVTLVAGLNGAGKSSVIEAVRYAHTLSCPRNSNRTNKPLINQNATDFQIAIDQNFITRESKTPITNHDPDLVAVAMDGSVFATAAAKDRKKLIARLFGIDVSIDKVCKEMKSRGIDDQIIAETKPYMKAGIDNAEKKAKSFANDFKSEWAGATGEKFGSIKSETWKAVPVKPNLLAIQDHILSDDVVASLTEKADVKKTEIQTLRNTIADYRKQTEHNTAAHEPCPSCGTLLTRSNGKLIEATPDDEGEKTINNAGKIKKAEQALSAANMELEAISLDLQQHYNAKNQLAGAEQQAIDDANALTERAKKLYDIAMSWDKCAKELAPDQIPALFSSKLPSALNKELAKHCAAAGFETVTADADLELSVNGITYSLLSESQKWRIDAVLSVVFAEISQVNFVAIDRLDVLNPSDRGGVLIWLSKIEFPTLIAGTLKQRPERLPAPVECVWLSDDEDQQKAA